MADLPPDATAEFRFAFNAQSEPTDEGYAMDLGVVDVPGRQQFLASVRLPLWPETSVLSMDRFVISGDDPVALRIGPSSETPVAGWLQGPGGARATGQLEDWLRIEVAGKVVGWVPADRVKESQVSRPASFERNVLFFEPVLSLEAASYGELMGTAETLNIAGIADFGQGQAPREAGVSVFRNGTKVDLLYLGDLESEQRQVAFAFEVPLQTGMNHIAVLAFQKNLSHGHTSLYYNKQEVWAGAQATGNR